MHGDQVSIGIDFGQGIGDGFEAFFAPVNDFDAVKAHGWPPFQTDQFIIIRRDA